jgi:uncharacterized protein (DUF4415 family)
MKSAGSSRKLPASRAEIEAAVARAPGKDRALTAREEAKWSTGVLVDGGGYQAVRKALQDKRKPGQRGPQVAPTKQLVSVRYSPEVLAFFKAGGAGWQSRMDDALKQWVSSHSKTRRRTASEV